MAVDKNLVSGSTTMLILKLLADRDMYGYEMIESLRERSQNVFELKAGTLYPLLHTLEEKGVLTVYEQEAAGKVRKYYRITKEGRKVLAQKQEEWRTYSQAVAQVLGAAGEKRQTAWNIMVMKGSGFRTYSGKCLNFVRGISDLCEGGAL